LDKRINLDAPEPGISKEISNGTIELFKDEHEVMERSLKIENI